MHIVRSRDGVEASDVGSASIRGEESGENQEQGRLPCTVGTDEADDLPVRKRNVESVERADGTERPG